MRLVIEAVSFKAACAFVAEHHRHHKPPRGHKFSIGVGDGEKVVGVIIVGRPLARMLQDGRTLEVLRCCTDGTEHACSKLYGAARRAAREMGYRRLLTYTLPEEGGASLRGSGWTFKGEAGGGSWNRKDRQREGVHPEEVKHRWEAVLT